MLEKIKGYRTYLTLFIGLVGLPLLDKALGFDVSGLVSKGIMSVCSGDFCADLASAVSASVQEIYLALIAALAAFFRAKAGK